MKWRIIFFSLIMIGLKSNAFSTADISKQSPLCLLSDTMKCKTFIIFFNNSDKDVRVYFIKSGDGTQQSDIIEFYLLAGKKKKIRVDDTDAIYNYTVHDPLTGNSQGNVDVDACATVEEKVIQD